MQGESIGQYAIDVELGAGGMGAVYRATVGDVVVALKVVHAQLLESNDAVERFQREIEIGKTVRHPNVVRTLDSGEADGRHYLAMEYVEGQTLRSLLTELERVPEELCRHVGCEVAKGLGAIHAAGAIHRDIKPENVLITPEHVVKIMDLGVARMMDDALRLSQTGAFVGSLHYAAPESFRGGAGQVDARVDLHALGLVLYELAGGSNPYLAEDLPRIVRKILHTEPRRLGELNPQLSPFFEEAVHCLLEKDREKRFASARELELAFGNGEDSAWWHGRAARIRELTKRPLRRVRVRRETAVYGREDDLAELRKRYDLAKSADGNVVLIAGEAGIGKSRLVDELIAQLQRDGEELNFLFGSYPPGGAATAAGAFSTAFREQFGDAGSGEFLAATPTLVAAFDALLRGEPGPEGRESLTKDSLQTCFVNATRALASERPTVVLIDDLHFAPQEGLSLFSALAMTAPEHRILLIGTMRPGMSKEWLSGVTRLDQTSQRALQRLGPKDMMALLRDSLRSERLAHDLAGQIATMSDGNPFFVFEILHGLREGKFITQGEDGTWVGTKVIEDIQIPSSVLDLVNARVADLTEDERDLLDVASCWGHEFDPALIGNVCGLDRVPSLKCFGHIERKHGLVCSVGRRFVFDHHQVQEALYKGLSEQLREEYHAALAAALELRTNAAEQNPETLDGALCVDLCEHHLKGARGQQALRYLAAAQTHLTNGYMNAQMASLTERVLAVPDLLVGAERAQNLLRLVDALDQMGRRAQQEEAAHEAVQLAEDAGDDSLRGQAARALGGVLWSTARTDEAEAAVRRALEIACDSRDRKAEAVATGNLGLVFYQQGRLAEARSHHERHLALSRENGDRHGEANAMGNLGNVLHDEGCLAEAREHHERALALQRELGDRQGETTCMGGLGAVFLAESRLTEAQEQYMRQLTLCREIGNRQGEAIATGSLGTVFLGQGRLDDGREHLQRNLVLCREIGNRQGEAIAHHNLGNAHKEEGNFGQAEECLDSCIALCDEIGFRHLAAATQLALGSLLAATGDEERGRESLTIACDVAADIGVIGVETLARCHLACLPGGDIEDARTAFTESADRLDAAESLEARWLLWRATGDGAQLAAAKRLLDEAVAHVDADTRTSMLTNRRLHREVVAAWSGDGD